MLARLTNTLDHVSDGRFGWNLVTGSNDGGAQNYGRDRQFPHDERYEMADEYVELVQKLWDSREPDAMPIDREQEIFADPDKYGRCISRGNIPLARPSRWPPLPQGHPVICQAGGSARGRTFAARWGETIISSANSIAAMKAFREDIRTQARAFGRDPDHIKVLFLVAPIVDDLRTPPFCASRQGSRKPTHIWTSTSHRCRGSPASISRSMIWTKFYRLSPRTGIRQWQPRLPAAHRARSSRPGFPARRRSGRYARYRRAPDVGDHGRGRWRRLPRH